MKKRLLVMSDDPVLQGFFHRNFRQECYAVMNTPATDEAFKNLLDRVQPDLVILDIGMPRLDGIEVCLRIRQWSDMPVIMLSTWGAASGKVKGLDLSSDSYLTEAFGITRLREQIDEVMGAKAHYQLSCNSAGPDNGG
ncbi:MAG: response regulator [Dehalococcoidales bacterium]|jgi:DNA-binding response OmpR family regulator